LAEFTGAASFFSTISPALPGLFFAAVIELSKIEDKVWSQYSSAKSTMLSFPRMQGDMIEI
jgi:hypothetical protein